MNWEFKTADELLRLCGFKYMSISDVMLERELQLGETTREAIMEEVDRCLRVMNVAVDRAISDPSPSMGGFLGGEAMRLRNLDDDKSVCGPVIHNAIINGVDSHFQALQGDASILKDVDGTFNLVVANINRNILLADMPQFHKKMASGAYLILSGFYTTDCQILIEKAHEFGFKLLSQTEDHGWACLTFLN